MTIHIVIRIIIIASICILALVLYNIDCCIIPDKHIYTYDLTKVPMKSSLRDRQQKTYKNVSWGTPISTEQLFYVPNLTKNHVSD